MRDRCLRRVVVTALLVGCLGLLAKPAEAYYWVNNLTYEGGEDDALWGHVGTYRDWYDPVNGSWYDYWCECYVYWTTYMTTIGQLYRPSGSVAAAGIAEHVYVAGLWLNDFPPDESGTWNQYGSHYVTQHVWDPGGYYCGGWTPCEQLWTTSAFSSTQAVVPGSCGGERDIMANEYLPGVVYQQGVSGAPNCSDFEQHSPGHQYTTHFTWSEWNGDFAEGNPHTEYGLVTGTLRDAVEAVRTIYGQPIKMSSAFRCPHGNASINGAAANSHHMRGRATDLYRLGGHTFPYWSEEEFNELKAIAESHWPPPEESFSYNAYSDRHYHVAW